MTSGAIPRVATRSFHMFPDRFGMLGSVDSNTGSPDLGWDTDQFPMDVKNTTLVMKVSSLLFSRQTGLSGTITKFSLKVIYSCCIRGAVGTMQSIDIILVL